MRPLTVTSSLRVTTLDESTRTMAHPPPPVADTAIPTMTTSAHPPVADNQNALPCRALETSFD